MVSFISLPSGQQHSTHNEDSRQKHIPLHITVAGNRVFVSYDGNVLRVMVVIKRATFSKRARCDGG